ncbi:MAG: glycoside hydrolase family 28 protein [Clostridia bacterium]|nr:glycoside hydrolase family 28 protein [Clostridia bacterium]
MVETIYTGSCSACFELKNDAPYYAPAPYRVRLDGKPVHDGDTNVFSLYGLQPDTCYHLAVEAGDDVYECDFRTPPETCALNVKDFGASGDGETDDTAAIQRAVLLLPSGGRLVFPEGVYRTAPIILKSHMTLELREGAVMLGETDKRRYPVVPALIPDMNGGDMIEAGTFEGMARDMYASLITAEYAEDITLVGPGRIDGNAQNGEWWKTFKADPVARPRLLFFNRCRNVTVHGIQAENSASWQLHPYNCSDIAFYGVSVHAPKDSPNTDALDPESCDGVEIVGCHFSVGDDCIAVKSGKIDPARPHKAAAKRHTIRNCLMTFGHGAITLGSEISGGVQEMNVSQCLFRQTDRGLRIKTRRGRGKGCDISGIAFDNIRMEGVLTPIVINMWYNCVDPDGNSDYVQSREKLPVDDRTPHLGTFSFCNMDCRDSEVAACYVDGLPEMPVDSVTLRNVHVSFSPDARPGVPAMMRDTVKCCRRGLYFDNVKQVVLENVTLEGVDGEKLTAKHVGSVTVEGSDVRTD